MTKRASVWVVLEGDRQGLGLWYERKRDAQHKAAFLRQLGDPSAKAVKYVRIEPQKKPQRRGEK